MMNNRYLKTFITSAVSIAPIIAIIAIFALSNIIHFDPWDYALLFGGGVLLIAGMALFSIGASQGLTKVGEYMGSSLSKQTNVGIIIIFAFLLGALITMAEPSILIVASDVSIPSWILLGSISVGVGIFVVIGVVRIIVHGSLKVWYLFLYFITFMLICLIDHGVYLPFIFDAGGITTGSATVPFILSLGTGIAIVRSGKDSHKDSFGLVGIASIGPILTMTILILVNQWLNPGGFDAYDTSAYFVDSVTTPLSILESFRYALLPHGGNLGTLLEVLIALLPIIVIFTIYQLIFIHLPWTKILRLLIGFSYSYIGLVLFLSAVSASLTPFGREVGLALGGLNDGIVIGICFVIGMVTILCEPAVHVLTKQIEEISSGTINKSKVLFILSIGVGIAICLAGIRTIYQFSIMYYIIPGYLLTFVLMFLSPDLYVAIAFDSGGTASGPVAVSFVLPMIIGILITKHPEADVYETAFGVVALIALTPILAIELLGANTRLEEFIHLRHMRHQVYDINDAEIIHFN